MPKVLDIVIEIIARITEGYVLFLMFRTFGVPKMKNHTAGMVITALIWAGLGKMSSLLAYRSQVPQFGEIVLSMALRLVIAFAVGMLLYRIRRMVCIFAVLLFTAMTCIWVQIGNGMGAMAIHLADILAMHIEGLGSLAYARGAVLVVLIIEDAMMIIMPLLSAIYITKAYHHSLNDQSTKEILSQMMPVLTGSLAAVILYYIFILISGNTELFSLHNYEIVYLFITLVFAALWFSILIGFKLQQDMIGLQEDRTQKRVLEGQLSQMQESMAQMERFYENTGRIRHDMKNQMNTLEKLLAEGHDGDGEIIRYFEDVQNALSQLEPKIHTGSAVADAVISSKFSFAAKEMSGIRLDAEAFVLTERMKVSPYDIGIILNNGLDNAIEACRRVRENEPKADDAWVYITLRSYHRQKMLFIEIENSFVGEILRGEDGLPLSDKNDGERHGYGLRNIRSTAQKYSGDIDCIVQVGKFTLSVMLKA